jgi:hypothetical protein
MPILNPPQENLKKLKIFIIIFIVLLIIIIFIVIVRKVILNSIKNERLQWSEKRCSSQKFMLFPTIYGPPGMTYAENNAFCEAVAINEVNKKNNIPFQKQLDLHDKTIGSLIGHIEDTDKLFFRIKSVLIDEVIKVRKDLYDTFQRLAFTYKTFKNLFVDIFDVYKSIFMAIKYGIWTLISYWNAPWGGGVIKFFGCFGEETLLNIKNKGIKKIIDLEIEDNIEDNIVIGFCKFKKDGDIYKLGNLYIAGMHLVEYNGEMIRIYNHPDAKLVKYDNNIIYNFITNTGRMPIDDKIYGDYLGDNSIYSYQKLIEINMKSPFIDNEFFGVNLNKYKNSAINLYPSFTHYSKLVTDSGIKRADELLIGDKINGKEIFGLVNYKLEGKTFITNYSTGKMVGIQIYYNNKNTISHTTIKQEEIYILGKLDCIGIIIDSGIIHIDNFSIMDFDIVKDKLKAEQEVFGI